MRRPTIILSRIKRCSRLSIVTRFVTASNGDRFEFIIYFCFLQQEHEERMQKNRSQLGSTSSVSHSNSELNSICPHKGSTKSMWKAHLLIKIPSTTFKFLSRCRHCTGIAATSQHRGGCSNEKQLRRVSKWSLGYTNTVTRQTTTIATSPRQFTALPSRALASSRLWFEHITNGTNSA